MTYTYKIETNPEIIAWIEKDGYQIVCQPHHPNAYMNAPWSSVEEAETWAIAEVARFEAEVQAAKDAELAAAAQITKIDEIHEMLVKLTQG